MPLTALDILSLRQNLSVAAPSQPVQPTNIGPFNPPTGAGVQQIDQTIQENQQIAAALKFPLDTPKYYTVITVNEYSRKDLSTVGKLNQQGGQIILPLPMQLMDNHQVAYEQKKMMAAGIGSSVGGAIGGQPGTVVGGVAGGIVGGVTSGAAALTGTEQTIANAVRGTIGPAQALIGFTPNEFVTILLRGPMYKKHELKFKLSPQNFKEAVQIRKMINVFNNAMAPSTALLGTVFMFPKIFTIAYRPNAGYLYKFKPCVLDNMVINFTGGGSPSFFAEALQGEGDGIAGSNSPPESIDLLLHFTELEYWLNGDFKDTNDPYDGAR